MSSKKRVKKIDFFPDWFYILRYFNQNTGVFEQKITIGLSVRSSAPQCATETIGEENGACMQLFVQFIGSGMKARKNVHRNAKNLQIR